MHVVSIPLQGMGIVFLLLLQKMGYSLAYVTGYKSAPGAVTTFLKTKQLSTAAFKQSNHKVSTPPHTQTQGVESIPVEDEKVVDRFTRPPPDHIVQP